MNSQGECLVLAVKSVIESPISSESKSVSSMTAAPRLYELLKNLPDILEGNSTPNWVKYVLFPRF